MLGACSITANDKVILARASLPPASLLALCVSPEKPVHTTRDLVDQLLATRGAFTNCANKIVGLRAWKARVEELLANAKN